MIGTRPRGFGSHSFKRRLLPLLFAAIAAGCTTSGEPLDAEVARQFDVENNLIADLTAGTSDAVPRDILERSIERAQRAGTEMRVVIANRDGDFVSARAVVDRYGGTAIAYQADRKQFEGASTDMSSAQLDRAIDAARVELDIGRSAAAFVDVIEAEGVERPGRSSTRPLLWVLLAVAAIFMLWNAFLYVEARTRRERRTHELRTRRTVLQEWAGLLGPEIDALAPAAIHGDESARRTLYEARDMVTRIMDDLDAARTLDELDAPEIRISRTAIKLRELRSSLGL